jgi:hypothetical protein
MPVMTETRTETKEELKTRNRDFAERTKTRAKEMITERKGQAAKKMGRLADALRTGARELYLDPRDETAAKIMEKAADKLEDLTNYLERTDVEIILKQAEEAARRHPAFFLGISFASGVALARFLSRGRASEFEH